MLSKITNKKIAFSLAPLIMVAGSTKVMNDNLLALIISVVLLSIIIIGLLTYLFLSKPKDDELEIENDKADLKENITIFQLDPETNDVKENTVKIDELINKGTNSIEDDFEDNEEELKFDEKEITNSNSTKEGKQDSNSKDNSKHVSKDSSNSQQETQEVIKNHTKNFNNIENIKIDKATEEFKVNLQSSEFGNQNLENIDSEITSEEENIIKKLEESLK